METSPDKKTKGKARPVGVELDTEAEKRQAVLVRPVSTTVKPRSGKSAPPPPKGRDNTSILLAIGILFIGVLAAVIILLLANDNKGANGPNTTAQNTARSTALIQPGGTVKVDNPQTAGAIATEISGLDLGTAVPVAATPAGVPAISAADNEGKNWPVAGGSLNNNRTSNTKITAPLKNLWAKEFGRELPGAPVIVGDTAYIGSDLGALYAVDIKSGDKKWFYKSGPVAASPAYANGIVYFGGQNIMYALDTNTKQKLWEYATYDAILSSPVVYNGVVYFGSQDGRLYAADANTGLPRCTPFTTDDTGLRFKNGITASPAVANGTVFVGTNSGKFVALNAADCTKKWEYNIPGGLGIVSSPAVEGNVVYFGADDGKLHALDTATGKEKWAFSTGAPFNSRPPRPTATAKAGATPAPTAVPITNAPIKSSPAIANGLIYFGSYDRKFYAVDLQTGKEKWSYQMQDTTYSSPVVVNGLVVFGSNDTNLYALDAATGQERWKFATPDIIGSGVVAAGGRIYVTVFDGKLYSFGN